MGDGASDATDAPQLVREGISVVFVQLENLSLLSLDAAPAAGRDQLALQVRVEDVDGGLGEEGGGEGVGFLQKTHKHLKIVVQRFHIHQ